MQFHPRDIGTLLIGYPEGAVIYSFSQNKPLKFFQYEVPRGAPGVIQTLLVRVKCAGQDLLMQYGTQQVHSFLLRMMTRVLFLGSARWPYCGSQDNPEHENPYAGQCTIKHRNWSWCQIYETALF